MKVTLEVPEKMGREMQALGTDLPAALKFGLASWRSCPTPTHRELAVAVQQLTTATSAEQVLALRPTPKLARRVRHLLDKNREAGLSTTEHDEMDAYLRVEHLVRLAKGTAALQLKEVRAA